ncbi:hypothetical protein GLOIN_2v1557521, partial [Rhizophagus irregularis DAOM 181602=DAOM 197198]
MDEIKLSDDVFEQIKDFNYRKLTEEQESLIDKLITDKELKERYKNFKQNFKNWTSVNHDVDEFIQKAQLNARNFDQTIEWIEYDKFKDVEYLAEGGFGTTFKAVWKDGPKVTLKCLHNSQDITADFF